MSDLAIDTNFYGYKRRFHTDLEPYFVMLRERKQSMQAQDWRVLVDKTAASIISNSEQYLRADLPTQEITAQFVREIFEEFIKDQGSPS